MAAWRAVFVVGVAISAHPPVGGGLPRAFQEPCHQRLLRVEPVLRLVPHHGLRAIDHLGGDLVLLNPTEQVSLVLDLTNMNSTLRSYASVDEAYPRG